MKKRNTNRITIGLKAEITSGSVSCEGVIENLSENGMFIITSPTDTVMDLTPGTILEVKFQFFSEETLKVNCKIKWSCKTPSHGLTNRIGMEIIDPPWEMSD